MYHHVTDEATAKAGSYASLNVTPEFFEKQMSYLETRGYHSVSMQDLINFFDNNTPLSSKPVLVTFDDGYEDFYTHAAPILQSHNIKATIFIPTGLVTVPNYLSWEELKSMSSNPNLLFANHTWSHQSASADTTKLSYEIKTADTQLKDHGLGQVAVFAYPYGPSSANAEQILGDLSYKLAFTTVRGFYQCKKQRFDLPRIRVGNAQLNSYGL